MIEVSSLGRMLTPLTGQGVGFGERDKELSFSRIEFGPCTLRQYVRKYSRKRTPSHQSFQEAFPASLTRLLIKTQRLTPILQVILIWTQFLVCVS